MVYKVVKACASTYPAHNLYRKWLMMVLVATDSNYADCFILGFLTFMDVMFSCWDLTQAVTTDCSIDELFIYSVYFFLLSKFSVC